MPHTTPPEELTIKLLPYQKKALEDAEKHFKQGLEILLQIPKVVDTDTYYTCEKHTDEILIIINNLKQQ